MKFLKNTIVLLLALCFICLAAPVAFAEGSDDERFAGKSWDQVVEEFLEEHNTFRENVTMGYYNTVTGEEHYYRGDEYMVSASLFKVPINMIFTDMIYNGEFNWDDTINGLTYDKALEWTIINSDNQVAEAMWNYLGGYRTYRELLCPYMGVDKDTVDDMFWKNNYFTSEQMIYCLRLLYENPDRFPRIIDTMKRAEPDDYFNYHEQEFEIAHKYGYLAEGSTLYLNDCGICYTDDPILIVMFTRGINRPYDVLSDFCTLMCDYTQYHTAIRFEQEAELAEQAAIEELESRTESETQTETAISAELLFGTNTSEKKEGGLLGIIAISALVIAVALMALAAAFNRARYGKLNLPWAVATVLIVALTLILCTTASRLGTIVSAPSGDPEETVSIFFNSLMSKDYESAYSYLSDYSSLGLENEPESEAAKLVYDALQDSWSYKLHGECRMGGLEASQQVLFTYLDINALEKDLPEASTAALNSLVQTLSRSEIFDENNNYLPSLTDAAYAKAVSSLLQAPEKYYSTVGLELQLSYSSGDWKISCDSQLLSALCGGAA